METSFLGKLPTGFSSLEMGDRPCLLRLYSDHYFIAPQHRSKAAQFVPAGFASGHTSMNS